jgi:hypothetical protein
MLKSWLPCPYESCFLWSRRVEGDDPDTLDWLINRQKGRHGGLPLRRQSSPVGVDLHVHPNWGTREGCFGDTGAIKGQGYEKALSYTGSTNWYRCLARIGDCGHLDWARRLDQKTGLGELRSPRVN